MARRFEVGACPHEFGVIAPVPSERACLLASRSSPGFSALKPDPPQSCDEENSHHNALLWTYK